MTFLDGIQVGAEMVSTVFLNLVKSLLAPLLFALIVSSLGKSSGDAAMGRIGLRTILYFEAVTGVAMLIGWAAMAYFQPGAKLGLLTKAAAPVPQSGATIVDSLVLSVPSSVVDAMSKNLVLPMMIFFGLMGWAARAQSKAAAPMIEFCDSLLAVIFGYAHYVMKLAPVGMIAAVVAQLLGGGWKSVGSLTKFVLAAVVAQLVMGVVIYGLLLLLFRIPVGAFLRATRQALGIAFATTSSAAALPKALEGMEAFGVRRELLGLVMPLGLSFNLAGSSIQLVMGVLFAAQAAGIELSWGQMLMVLLTLKVAVKGVAGIPRANFVILSATLPTFQLPIETLPLLLAVDGIIDMVRTPVNVLGNCLAPAIIARWEGESLTEQSSKL
jgi:proton glutamate symport protein